MAEDLPDAPWAKPQQQQQPEELPDAPWTQPPKRKNTTVLDYGDIYKEMRKESQGQMARGVEQLTTPQPGISPLQGYWTGLKGWGNIGLGALGYVGSPIAAGIRTVVGEPLEQRTGLPKEYSEFATSLAIPGIGLPRVPGTRPNAIPTVPSTGPMVPEKAPVFLPDRATKITGPREGKIADEVRLFTKGGQERQAALAIEHAADDPAAVRRALGDVEEILPDSPATTFQASGGDRGLGQLERGAATGKPAPFLAVREEQGVARIKALESAERPGVPEEVSNSLRARMAANDAAAEVAEQEAIARAGQMSQAAQARAARADQAAGGTGFTPDISGQVFQRELVEANAAIKINERQLWQGVDPQNRLSVNTAPVMNGEFRIYRDNLSIADTESITDAERAIQRIVGQYGPVVPFREMQDLRSFVSTTMRDEMRARGPTKAYARMAQLRAAVEESAVAPFEAGVPAGPGQAALSADAADRLAAATAATQRRSDLFKVKPIEDIIKPGQGGQRMTPSAVPANIISSGPKGYDNVNAYLRATAERPGGGLEEVSEALVADMRARATDVNGNIDPGRLMGWARSKEAALRAVSERDGGVLGRRLDELQQSGFGVKAATKEQPVVAREAAAQRAAVSKAEKEGIFGTLIGVRDKDDISKVLGSIFGSKTSVADAEALMARLATPEAQDGARRAITDWIARKLVSNTSAGTSEVNILKADQFQTFIKDKVATLNAFGFAPEQIKIWQDIARDMRRSKMSETTKLPGGSNTAQDYYAMKKFGLSGTKLSKILHVAGTALGSVTGSAVGAPWIGAIAGFFGAGKYTAIRESSIKSVQDLIARGMSEPEFGLELLKKITPQENIAFMRTMGLYSKRAARAAAISGQTDYDMLRSEPTPKGYAYGGAIFPVGREGIQTRNKARAFEARERSSLARQSAQAKRKVKKYAEGGLVPMPRPRPTFTSDDEVEEGQSDPTSWAGRAQGSDAQGRGGFFTLRGEVLKPETKGQAFRNVVPTDLWQGDRFGELAPHERQFRLDPLEQDYHKSYGVPAGPGVLANKPYPVYADGGLTKGSEGDIGDAAAAFSDHPTINAMERMHQARKQAQGIALPPPPMRQETSILPKRLASGGRVNDDSGKVTKASVNYGKGMPKAHCSICTHWQHGKCSEVQGKIWHSMWCELFKRAKKYQEGGLVEEDPLEAEKRRRNVPGGLSATAGPTVTSTTPVQDIPAPKVNKEGETLPTYVLKEMGKGLLGAPEHFTHAAGDLQRRGEYAGSQEDMPYGGPPPEEMPAGAAAALMLYGANAPFPKPGIGVFGGRGALTANKGMLAEAEKMLAAGVPHATIRNRTGWEFGSEGKPKFEISDAESRIIPEAPSERVEVPGGASRDTGFRPNRRLEEVFHHPRLYEAYPWLRDMPTTLEVGEGIKPGASFTPYQHKGILAQGRGPKGAGEVEVRAPTYERGGVGDLFEKQYASDVGARDMLLHEIQHAIQEREGFAPGANPRQLPIKQADVVTITRNMAKRNGVDYDAAPLQDKQQMERLIRHRIYKAQAGEAEARNVQTRADSTLPSRPSWETEDIKRPNQMIQKTGKLKPGEKPFADTKIYKSEYEGPEYRSEYKDAQAAPAEAVKAPEVPMLLGNPELRGSMSTLDNMPFTYRGKGPAEWTPQEFAEVGKHFGVERLGPESPATPFKYADGQPFNIPGGLEGQFTYYDMLRMKADGIDPSRVPRELHIPLQQKLMRSMDVAQPVSPERTWSGLTFGMTSPNNPLFPNQLTQSVLRIREPGLRQQLANSIPWKVGDKVSQQERLAASNRIANMLGIDAESRGGLGVRGSTDYTRIAELAQMWEKNPQWFTKTDAESWPNYVERLTSQVKGTAMKTGSFGGVWQDPAHAGISAIDRHMVNEFERTGKLFQNKAEERAFKKRAVERWNNANEGDPVKSYGQLKSKGEGFLTKMKLEYVGNEQNLTLRTRKGEISPNVPPHLANVDWPSEPSHVKVMGEAYRRALDWNQQLATQQGLNLFPSQWLEWDRIRRRFEPHENMFPGLERMPAMSREQLRKVSEEHTASGHKTYEKTEGEEGQMNLQPTRPRPNPAGFAYFTVPPVVGAAGAIKGLVNNEEE